MVHREPLTFRRIAALAGIKLLVLVAVAVPVPTALPYGSRWHPLIPVRRCRIGTRRGR